MSVISPVYLIEFFLLLAVHIWRLKEKKKKPMRLFNSFCKLGALYLFLPLSLSLCLSLCLLFYHFSLLA